MTKLRPNQRIKIAERYMVDKVMFTGEMFEHLQSLGSSPPTLLVLNGTNPDSKIMTPSFASFFDSKDKKKKKWSESMAQWSKVDNSPLLFNEMSDLRVIKTPMEQGKDL